MKRTVKMMAATMVGVLAIGLGAALAEETNAPAAAKVKAQTTCPVMAGGAINTKIYSDYNGKRIYFCCSMCPKTFAKDPEKYIKKMQDDGVTLEDAPKAADAK